MRSTKAEIHTAGLDVNETICIHLHLTQNERWTNTEDLNRFLERIHRKQKLDKVQASIFSYFLTFIINSFLIIINSLFSCEQHSDSTLIDLTK